MKALGAGIVLIDAPDAFLTLLDHRPSERAELRSIHEWLLDSGLTSILTVSAIPADRLLPTTTSWTTWPIA